MLKTFDPKSLLGKNRQELLEIKAQYFKQKGVLEKNKASNSKWSDENQELLENTVLFIVDIDDAIAALPSYTPAKGLEKHIHLLIHHGNSFSPATGELISEKHIQIFTYSEWTSFKKSFARLGYTIDDVLYDPYNEAYKYIKH